jgi:hypothetical protein
MVRLAKLGQKAERRREARNGCLMAIWTGASVALISGWMFMLGVGIVHHEWIHQCPTIGYWWAVLASSLFRSALSSVQSKAGGSG